MTDSHKGGTKSENVADSWEEAGDELSYRVEIMTRGSRRLQAALAEKDKALAIYAELVHYCGQKSNDLDVIHAQLADYKDRLKEENLFLRQCMWNEGWRFLGQYVVDPFGNSHPFFWGNEKEEESAECYFYSDETKLYISHSISEINLRKERSEDILKAREEAGKWKDASGATEKFFDERKKEIEMKKQKEEELLKAREAAQQMQEQDASPDKPTFQILKRPQGFENQSTLQQDMARLEEKTRTMTFQEREAAYFQARERIFGGGYRPEDELNVMIDSNPPMVVTAAGCMATAVIPPHPSYQVSVPRPRLPLILRTRPALYQQPPPLSMPPFGIPPPPPGAYTAPLPPIPQQRFPLATSLQQLSTQSQQQQQQQRYPYFDSRIPPPTAPPSAPYMGQNFGQNSMGIASSYSDSIRSNPVPYGRPPAQLLLQNQFTPAFNDQTNRFY